MLQKTRALCKRLNERFLCPLNSEALKITVTASQVPERCVSLSTRKEIDRMLSLVFLFRLEFVLLDRRALLGKMLFFYSQQAGIQGQRRV